MSPIAPALVLGLLLSGGDAAIPLPGAPDGATPDLRIGLPGRGWFLSIHPADFEFGPPTAGPTEGTVWASGDSVRPGLSLTVVLRVRPEARTVENCREILGARAGVGSCTDRDVDCSAYAGMATLEYRMRHPGALAPAQRQMRAYLYHDGVCGEIQLSEADSRRRERRRFLELLDEIERVDEELTAPPRPPGDKRRTPSQSG